MRKLEIIGHVFDNVNGRAIVTAPDEKERSLETYLNEAKLFPYLGEGYWVPTVNSAYGKFVKYKKAEKIAKIPKVKITITVEEV